MLYIIINCCQVHADDNSPIRVRLLAQTKEISFQGEAIAFNGQRREFLPVAIPQFSKWTVQVISKNEHRFWLVTQTYPISKSLIYGAEQPLTVLGKNISDGEKIFPGLIRLTTYRGQQFDVVSVLPLKNYLVGVLNGEMPKSWPLETLKAQSVASRSYAESIMKMRINENFDVDSDIRDQVFNPPQDNWQNDLLLTSQQLAVKQTQNVILTEKNKVVKAYFHSDCGGESASANSVWGESSQFPATNLKCVSEKRSSWVYKINETELFEKIKLIWSEFDKNQFSLFQWLHLPELKRVSNVKIILSNGDSHQIRSQDFRRILGYSNLKSTLFQVNKEGNQYVFSGSGFGHGVGLCQHGAKKMGELGYDYKQILSHYYPETKLSISIERGPSFAFF